MVEEEDQKKEEIFDFDASGEVPGYISLEQARVLAIRHASENTAFYGRRFGGVELFWEVVSADEDEDYYHIRVSYRPVRRFRGEPGIEQFTIDKAGSIELRQIISEPRRRARWPQWSSPLGVALSPSDHVRRALASPLPLTP